MRLEAEKFTKIFGKWDPQVEIRDPGLAQVITISPRLHTFGRHASTPFAKYNISILERLINRMMRKGANTGKKQMAYNIVKQALEIVHQRTNQNPIQILIQAIENASPREDVVKLKYGGIMIPKAVDVSSRRRVDQALNFITEAAMVSSFRSKKPIWSCLADEIIAAARNDPKSHSIKAKEERERIAKASR